MHSYTWFRKLSFCSLVLKLLSAKNGPSMYDTIFILFFPRFLYVFVMQNTGAFNSTGYLNDTDLNGLICI